MTKLNDDIIAIANYLKENDDFILIMHIAPDGDTIGSTLALYAALRGLGKRVQAVCHDKMPVVYSFLPHIRDVITPEKAVKSDNAIAIDCAGADRMGRASALFEAARHTVSIDHHGTNTMFAELNKVDPSAAAAGEIIYKIIYTLLDGRLTRDIADCLYTAVLTDTGCFAHSNTTENSFQTAAELMRFGIDPSELNRLIYRTVSLPKTRLLGYALSNVELFNSGSIGMCVISQADLGRVHARAEDTEGIIDHIRDIESVQIAMFIRECLDGDYKVSLRSVEGNDVAMLAQNFGGGGHPCAAGFKITMELNTLIDMLLDSAREIMEA